MLSSKTSAARPQLTAMLTPTRMICAPWQSDMTASDASNSDTIVLTAHGRADTSPPRRYFVLSLIVLTAGAGALAMDARLIGILLLIAGCLFLAVTLQELTTITTFDLTRRLITIGRIGPFRTTIRQTLPLDMAYGIDILPGRGGAVLWLKDGTILNVTDAPEIYIGLEKRLVDVRARLGLAVTPPAAPTTVSSRDISPVLNWPVVFTASNRPGRGTGVMGVIFAGMLFYTPTVLILEASPLPTTKGKILLILMLFVINLPMFAISFFTLFGRIPRLTLDPTTRQAHFAWSWPIIWPNETISFDDVVAAGVWEGIATRDFHALEPYVQLASGRIIRLTYFSDDFRAAQDIAGRICQVTGAEFRNKHALPDIAAKRHSTPEKAATGSV